jgi:hypothetical protein
MKKLSAVLGALALAISGAAWAADEMGSPDEAKAMSEKAAAAVAEMGKDKAFAAFADAQGGLRTKPATSSSIKTAFSVA